MWYGDWVGADAFDWSGAGWRPAAAASYQDGSRYRSFGGYLMTEGDPLRSGHHILRTSLGYRLSGMGGDSPASDRLPATDFDHLGHVVCASLQYLYSDAANVALTFSQGFRAPNLNEAVMIGDTGKFFHVPNRALEPERSDTFELLARGRYRGLTFGATGYVSLLDQLIKRVPTTWQGLTEVDGKPVVHNVNGASGLLWGVEGELSLSLPRGFSIAGTLSYTRGTEHIPEAPDQPLTRIPPLFGGGRLRYETPHWRGLHGYVETFVRVAASQGRLSAEDEKDVRIPEGGTPGWWTWNLRGGLWLAERISLQLSLENLLDRRYKYHGSGLYAPGINATATLSAAL
jgi:outer membrane receptor protein involved in Fe transport